MTLTDRQATYAQLRANGTAPTAAARAAGYSTRTAKNAAAKLERHADVARAIAEQRRPPAAVGLDAEGYLEAVVSGAEVPDPIRVMAARALLAYQKPRQRRPLPPARTPKAAAASDATAAEREQGEEWERRSAEIRARRKRP